MKKIFLILIALIFSVKIACAENQELQGVFLETSSENLETSELIANEEYLPTEVVGDKTLKEKLRDVYHLEIEEINRPSYLLSNILTKHNEDALIEETHLWGAYNADWSMTFKEDGDIRNHYGFNAVNVGLDGKFRNDSADFRIMLGVRPLSHRNMVQDLFADVYIATNKIPHHRIMLGNMRPKVGMEGGNSSYTLPFAARSQIARNYGAIRKFGGRVIGDYSLVEYELGGYNSATFFEEFFPGTEFTGWVNFKPLGKTDGRYGELKIGGGIDKGRRDSDFCITGAYIGYEYKKWMLNFEWANGDGSNGGFSGHQSENHSRGFYATLAYRITPKLQALVRYDEFDPDTTVKHNNKREYTAGINYFIKGQALRLIFNYIFCQNEAAKDSHRILLGTQILF